jgi:hypothetical protein
MWVFFRLAKLDPNFFFGLRNSAHAFFGQKESQISKTVFRTVFDSFSTHLLLLFPTATCNCSRIDNSVSRKFTEKKKQDGVEMWRTQGKHRRTVLKQCTHVNKIDGSFNHKTVVPVPVR